MVIDSVFGCISHFSHSLSIIIFNQEYILKVIYIYGLKKMYLCSIFNALICVFWQDFINENIKEEIQQT